MPSALPPSESGLRAEAPGDDLAQDRSFPSSPTASTPDPNIRALTLSVFDEVLRALAHGERLEDTFLLLAEKARLLTGGSSTAIALLNPDRETLTFVAVAGKESEELLGSRVHLADTMVGKTARTGEPYLAFRPYLVGNGLTEPQQAVISAAVVPIFDEGRPVGAFATLNKAQDTPFGGEDLMALTTLAAAASITLRNTRLQSDALRQSRELSHLYDAVRSVSGKLTAQEVLRTVVEQAASLLENSAVVIFLTNDERTHLYIAEDTGLDDIGNDLREVTLSAESGLGASILSTSLPVFLSFPETDDEGTLPAGGRRTSDGTLQVDSPFPALGARSGLAAAIRSGDSAQGLLLVLTGQPSGAYTVADSNLLSALASQAAVAMENSWLYEDATRRAEEAATLYELSQTVTSTLRLPQVLERVADSVLTLLGVDKFALFLHDAASERLEMVVERNLPPGAAERVRPAIGQGIPGWVMEFETPTAVQDVAADHRNASAPLHPEGVVSMTCMPLQVGAATTGVLCAMSSRRRLFTVAEMELLYTVANQAAIAIENARMYEDVRQKSLELRKSFHRVARALGSSRSPHTVPDLIVSLTQELTGADYCALYSLQQGGASSLRLEGSVGFRLAPPQPNSTAGETPTAWIARKGRSLAITDVEEDEQFRARFLRPARGKVSGYLGVPLKSGEGDIIGVLEVYTRSARAWRAEEIRLLLAFASQATVAFQNASLVNAGKRAARRADGLAALLKLATDTTAPVILSTALTALRDGTEFAGGILVLRREDLETPWRVAASQEMESDRANELLERINAQEPVDVTSVTSDDGQTYVLLDQSRSTPVVQEMPRSQEELTSVLRAAIEIFARAV